MVKTEQQILGIAGIIIGLVIYIKTREILIALMPTIIGLALILFAREEDKIEERKDIKNKNTRKKENE